MHHVKKFPNWSTWLKIIEPPRLVRQPLPGWIAEPTLANPVVEPRLHYAAAASSSSQPRIILVAAPGAVGKSTLARFLAGKFGHVLVDLAETGPIGENFITGGLFRCFGAPVVEGVEQGSVGLMFDALDEAKLRVTPEAFEAFIDDVSAIAMMPAALPVVLFGRTSTIESTWLLLADKPFETAMAEISFFNRQEAERYVDGYADMLSVDGSITRHNVAYQERRNELLDKLKKETSRAEGAVRLEGYAPVLFAMARILASAKNYSVPLPEINAKSGRLIESLPREILKREQAKFISSIQEKAAQLGLDVGTLYSPDEQRYRLLPKLISKSEIPEWKPVVFPTAESEEMYEFVVRDFLEQHPFLDGSGLNIGSAVFEADLWASAIFDDIGGSRSAAVSALANPRIKPNPFLLGMISSRLDDGDFPDRLVAADCVGPMYDSMRSSVGIGESAVIEAYRVVHRRDENRLATLINMSIRGDEVAAVSRFSCLTSFDAPLVFSRGLDEAVLLVANRVVIGDGDTVRLTSPSLIDAESLVLRGSVVEIEPSASYRRSSQSGVESDGVVIVAKSMDDSGVSRAPRLIGGAKLAVTWPGSNRFPWLQYSFNMPDAPKDVELQRLALRRLVLSFRSHSKGALARYADKIEHFRMTRGDLGDRIREALLRDKVLSLKGSFYFLDPDRLGSIVGISYRDIKEMRFSTACDDYLRRI